MDDFRRFFLRGLAALVPTLLTFAILVWAYLLVNDYVGVPITRGLMALCQWLRSQPAPGMVDEEVDPLAYGTPIEQWDEFGQRLTIEHKAIHYDFSTLRNDKLKRNAEHARNTALWQIAFRKYRLHFLGFVIAIVLVYFVGFFLASFMGRATWRAAENLLLRIPLIRAVYPNVKQVTDFLLSERSVEFSGVVAVEYPRKGIWSLGLSTGGPMDQLQRRSSEELVSVFIPSSPTPITGYVIQAPRSEVIDLNLTIDEGLRFIISGGVIKPGTALPSRAVATPSAPGGALPPAEPERVE